MVSVIKQGLFGIVLFLVVGCVGPGLLGSGLYRTSIGGPLARVGMSPGAVEAVMGPSWEKISSTSGAEAWHYGVNILGLIGPTCSHGRRGGDVMCITVYFIDGKVYEVMSY